MKKIIRTLSLLMLIGVVNLQAAHIHTVLVPSLSMNKDIKTTIVIPNSYDSDQSYPVVYLLHGYSGNEKSWVNDMPATKALADKYDMLIVCPDANYNSWYFDSPINDSIKYETFVAKELVEWVDKRYATIKKREGRAITGLSMGGHGGLFLGFRHQDVFGACGSMSGGVDIRPFPNNWGLPQLLGTQNEHVENWESHTVINQLHLLSAWSCRIIIDCGVDDFFYPVNLKLHNELKYRNIPHDFISRPGGHDRAYWNNAVQYQALFFHNYFQSAKSGNNSSR